MKKRKYSFDQKLKYHHDRTMRISFTASDKPELVANKVRYSEGFLMGANGASYDKDSMHNRSVRLGWLRGRAALKKHSDELRKH